VKDIKNKGLSEFVQKRRDGRKQSRGGSLKQLQLHGLQSFIVTKEGKGKVLIVFHGVAWTGRVWDVARKE